MVDRTLLEQAMKLPDSERLELADALRESIAYRDPELNDEVRAVLADAEQDVSDNPAHERAWSRARRELFPHLA
ncbi:MAG: addiction module protein [Cryobacterium sp.]|nr:addiction module protein [Cryobacterium sp.]